MPWLLTYTNTRDKENIKKQWNEKTDQQKEKQAIICLVYKDIAIK